ncbi:MAG: M48 family metallopeptidase [Planctomycetales bacterium]|nr:M48 family metallopeptidase [Planctomycetales bacterium]
MWTRRQFHQLAWTAGCGCLLGCRSTPVTNRNQLMLIQEDQELTLGKQSYEEATAEVPRSQNAAATQQVMQVGQRIAAVANRPDYQWEFRVLATAEQNAFALPGGKVAVHEGILPVCLTEAGLAVVMSHEIAHALARHGGERMSQGMAVNGVKQLGQYVMRQQPTTRQDQLLQAYGVVSKYAYVLPYSRRHESEADHIGLMLMARAGYNPEEAPRFWQRFAALNNAATPEFLSTHPASETRVQQLTNLLPEAQKLYVESPQQVNLGQTLVLS